MSFIARMKHILEDDLIFYALIIVLVAVASFGLGKYGSVPTLLATVPAHDIVITQTPPKPEVAGEKTQEQEMPLVGSKNGTKYHLLTCPGASQIHEENKVFFASKDEAAAMGYTPAANCHEL